MKVLITGGTGYIGSHTVVEFIQAGFEVIIADDLSNSQVSILDNIYQIAGAKPNFYELDICDKAGLYDLFKKEKNIDAVIHFAAHKSVSESTLNPIKYYRNNLVSLLNLIDATQDFKINHFIFSSSCAIYGQPEQLPVTESAPFKTAESVYGYTKQICENIISDFCKSNNADSEVGGFQSISLRYFNLAGAHESGLLGELPTGDKDINLFPLLMRVAAGSLKELQVFGNDYDTLDGTPVRDYIHVVDLAKAHVAALKYQIEGKQTVKNKVFNLGTGKGYTVLEVIQAFEKITGAAIAYNLAPRRHGDTEKVYADNQLAQSELQWQTEKGLDDMVSSAWNWQKVVVSS